MRAALSALTTCLFFASAAEAAANPEWVVLRVERVEVAVAHADGTPWDTDSPTGETCGLFSGGSDFLASKTWGPVARSLCPPAGGPDPTAPDLFLRLAAADLVEYVSPIAADTLAHDFRYEFLVPVEVIAADAITISVHDSDGAGATGELLGTIPLSRRDLDRLLARGDRVKTYSDGAVTRIDVSARRYRAARRTVARLGARQAVVRALGNVVAGEEVRLHASPKTSSAIAVLGANLNSTPVDRCARGIVQSSGGIAVGTREGDAPLERATTFTETGANPRPLDQRHGQLVV